MSKGLPENQRPNYEARPKTTHQGPSGLSQPPSMQKWETLAEQRMQAAIDEGAFAQLPGMGKPLPDLDPNDSHWWIKQKCREEGLEVLPPALELKRKVERRLDAIVTDWHSYRDQDRVRAKLTTLNQEILDGNHRIGWGPPSDVQPIEIEAWLEKLQSLPSGEAP